MNSDLLRLAALAAVLLAGSCAAPTNGDLTTADAVSNHPITIHPEYRASKFSYSGANAGLMPEDTVKLDSLVRDYLERGDGSISVSAPDGPESGPMITYFGERLAQMGVPRSRILVGSHPVADGDGRVEISFVSFVARTAPCGDWSVNVAETASNLPMPNFGCAVQSNVAAMVANPHDLEHPRAMDQADATRRATVMGHYEKGETTQADKRSSDKQVEQSAPGSGLTN